MTTNTTSTNERYRIQHPTMFDVMRDLRIPSSDPGPGSLITSFDLPTLDGGRFASADFTGDGQLVLLVFGSITCPVTESAGNGLVKLHEKYGDKVRFVVVDVREAHPGASLAQPSSRAKKRQHAIELQRHHGFPFEVAVDDLDGGVHRAFGTRPSSAYLIDPNGKIIFRAHWSNLTEALDEALAAATSGRPIQRTTAGQTIRSIAKMTGHADAAFTSAGPGAMRDTWIAAPPFAAMITISRLFSFLPRDRRGVPAIATMSALVTGALALVFGVAL